MNVDEIVSKHRRRLWNVIRRGEKPPGVKIEVDAGFVLMDAVVETAAYVKAERLTPERLEKLLAVLYKDGTMDLRTLDATRKAIRDELLRHQS